MTHRPELHVTPGIGILDAGGQGAVFDKCVGQPVGMLAVRFDTEGNPGHDLRIGQKSAKTRACKASILHRFSPKVHFLATELRRRHCGGAAERGLGDLCYSR